jgi:ribosome biogenesis GTPase / thiamine phosphate phosphatase
MTQEYDESDVRERPNPRGTRPRSKQRPRHAKARWGMVALVDRGRYRVVLPADEEGPLREVNSMRARELGRRSLAVGDRVGLVGQTDGLPDSLARIVLIDQRRSSLRRTPDDTDAEERVIVANADLLAVVVAAADPAPRFGFVDRALVAGYDGGLAPIVVASKADLAPPDSIVRMYASLDVPVVPVHRGGDLTGLMAHLAGRVSVLIGQSGVGKSTLVNALVPQAARATGSVNDVTGRGRHTSTSVQALSLPSGGWIIDTPGVRSFGLGHVDVSRIISAFPEIESGTAECPRGCTHLDSYCGLDDYVASGAAGPGGPERLASLRRLLATLGTPGDDQAAPSDQG